MNMQAHMHMCTHNMQLLWDTTVLYTVPHWPPTCRDTAAVDHSSRVPSSVLPPISPAIDRYVPFSTRCCSPVVKNINCMTTYTGMTYSLGKVTSTQRRYDLIHIHTSGNTLWDIHTHYLMGSFCPFFSCNLCLKLLSFLCKLTHLSF